MTGMLLFALAGLWVCIAFMIGRWIGSRFNSWWRRALFSTLAFVALLPLPVLDEIIGGHQFRSLCNSNASRFHLGVANPEGRTVRVSVDPANRYLDGTAIPVRHSHMAYRDVVTGEEVIDFDEYAAEGGLLIRWLGISESKSPLAFGRSACSPEDVRGENVRLTFKFNVIK